MVLFQIKEFDKEDWRRFLEIFEIVEELMKMKVIH
jgi:hypothetical protein